MIAPGKKAEHVLLQKLSAATRIPRKEFIASRMEAPGTNEELPLYSYPVLSEHCRGWLDPLFYSVTLMGKPLSFAQMVEPRKWAKCELRDAFFQGRDFLPQMSSKEMSSRYVLSTYLLGTVWITTLHPRGFAAPSSAVTGRFPGGVMVTEEGMGVFVSRPVKNFLAEYMDTLPDDMVD